MEPVLEERRIISFDRVQKRKQKAVESERRPASCYIALGPNSSHDLRDLHRSLMKMLTPLVRVDITQLEGKTPGLDEFARLSKLHASESRPRDIPAPVDFYLKVSRDDKHCWLTVCKFDAGKISKERFIIESFALPEDIPNTTRVSEDKGLLKAQGNAPYFVMQKGLDATNLLCSLALGANERFETEGKDATHCATGSKYESVRRVIVMGSDNKSSDGSILIRNYLVAHSRSRDQASAGDEEDSSSSSAGCFESVGSLRKAIKSGSIYDMCSSSSVEIPSLNGNQHDQTKKKSPWTTVEVGPRISIRLVSKNSEVSRDQEGSDEDDDERGEK